MRVSNEGKFFFAFIIVTLIMGFLIGNYLENNRDNHLHVSHENVSHDKFHEMLGLTSDQLAKLVPIEKEFTKKKAYYENLVRSANMELGDIMLKEKSFTPKVRVAVKKTHTAMGELQNITLIHFFDMRNLLDEKQAQIFDNYVADVMYGL